jgi:hypothetical protein
MEYKHENVDPVVAEEIRDLALEGIEVDGTTVFVSDDVGEERLAAIATVCRQDLDSRTHSE